jgi:hypothetical protein
MVSVERTPAYLNQKTSEKERERKITECYQLYIMYNLSLNVKTTERFELGQAIGAAMKND